MKKINITMFGEKSVSTLLYYMLYIVLTYLILYFGYLLFSLLFGNYSIVEYTTYVSYNIPSLIDGLASEISIRIDVKGVFSWLFFFVKNGLFLYLLILVFKNFKKSDVLFTRNVLRSLKFFSILNICMPLVYVLFDVLMFQQLVFENIEGAFGNLYLGLLTLFVLAIFKQGYKIQQENDLTI